MTLLRTGMAELKIGIKGDKLQALGLGSCIGLILVDKQNHVGGMLHVMLPESSIRCGDDTQSAKFADTGVPLLFEEVVKAGAHKSRLIVLMAGGAEMYAFTGKDSPKLSVGKRNIEAVHEQLKQLGLKIDAEDTGGSYGRTMEIDLDTLHCTIKVVGKEISDLYAS